MRRILPLAKYRVIVQAQHRLRGYAYVIVRTDLPEWAECSQTLYATLEAASEAG
jgi:heat shock protein HspQ